MFSIILYSFACIYTLYLIVSLVKKSINNLNTRILDLSNSAQQAEYDTGNPYYTGLRTNPTLGENIRFIGKN